METRASIGIRRPWYSPLRLLQRVGIYFVVGYLTFCTFLYVEQNSVEYPRLISGVVFPLGQALEQARLAGLMPWPHRTPGALPPQGYIPKDFAKPTARGTFVVFHGNGSWSGAATAFSDAFSRRGFRTFFYEYPGYGGRPGTPSEKVIVPDARAVVYELAKEGYGPIYIWGESLGAGVAAAVCADPTLPVRGLVLASPWDTVANVGYYRYPIVPVGWLMVDKYDSIANLSHFQHPICLVRGTTDTIVPPSLSIHLFAHLPNPKKLIIKQGFGHGDWPNSPELTWWDDAIDFVAPR